MKELERINKSIITADSIEARNGWSLSQKENPTLCSYCKSPLFYVWIEWGVVEESELFKDIKVLEKGKHYWLREVGLVLYCAECGHLHNDYCKYFYPKDRLVCSWSDKELDLAEIEEIKYCLKTLYYQEKIIKRKFIKKSWNFQLFNKYLEIKKDNWYYNNIIYLVNFKL